MTLTLQKNTDQIFCSLSNAVCLCFPMIRWRLYGFVKNTTGVMLCPFLFFFFFFHASCRILVSRPTLKPVPSALGAWSPVHWTAREFLGPFLCVIFDRIRIGWTAKKFEEFLWFITVTMKSVILFIYSINIEFYLCPPTANIKQRW